RGARRLLATPVDAGLEGARDSLECTGAGRPDRSEDRVHRAPVRGCGGAVPRATPGGRAAALEARAGEPPSPADAVRPARGAGAIAGTQAERGPARGAGGRCRAPRSRSAALVGATRDVDRATPRGAGPAPGADLAGGADRGMAAMGKRRGPGGDHR